jgi:hypothetical protein
LSVQPPQAVPVDPAAPVTPPRGVSKLVRRRIWLEPSVRFWWLAGAVMLLVAVGFSVQDLRLWLQELRLIRQGAVVPAMVLVADGIDIKDKKLPPTAITTLRYQFKGKTYDVTGTLAGRKELILTGHPVDLRIDPDQPDVWTYRSEPTSIVAALLGPIIVFPLGLIGLLVALWKRGRLERLWKTGPARLAIVIETRQTALAPMSKLVRVTPQGVGDRRLYTVYVPHTVRQLQHGDLLWMISHPDNATHVAAAVWFE